jgi:protein KRI1
MTRGWQSKPITYKQQAFKALLETNKDDLPGTSKTHVQEQADLRAEMVAAFRDALPSELKEGEDDLLVLRENSKDETEREEQEYQEYIKREVGDLKEIVWADESALTPQAIDDTPLALKKPKSVRDKGKAKAEENKVSDQEFLMKWVLYLI